LNITHLLQPSAVELWIAAILKPLKNMLVMIAGPLT
jgi:hypothetical protein